MSEIYESGIIIPSIYFENTLPVSYVGCKSSVPLRLIFWDNVVRDTHIATLYSRGSKSIPYYEKNNRWDHLLPRWRFLDLEGNVVESVSSTNTTIYYDTSAVGVSGYADFYYVDDMPTGQEGLVLIASLSANSFSTDLDDENAIDLPSFANSRPDATLIYNVNDLPITHLNVTRDGLREHRPYYWTNTKIPYTITTSNIISQYEDCTGILFSYPQLSSVEFDYYIEIDDVDSNLFPINSSFKAFDEDGLPIGGFVRGTMQPLSAYSTARFTASTEITYESLYSHQPHFWVSNPENRTLNRFVFQVASASIHTADTLVIDVPYVESIIPGTTESPYATGFAGIWGIGVDSLYNVWVADTELDVVNKYKANGELITSIQLERGTAPAGIAIDANRDVFVTLMNSVSTLKISTQGTILSALIPENGLGVDEFDNYIFSPGQVETDINSDIWVSYTNPLCSCVIKYDNETLEEVVRIPLGQYETPFDLDIGEGNTLYLTTQFFEGSSSYETRHFAGGLHSIDSSNTLTTELTGLNNPHYLAVDINDNVWFSEGTSVVSVLSSGNLVSVSLSGGEVDIAEIERVEAAASVGDLGGDAEIGGISHTAYGYTYVIQSKENMVYVFNTNTFELAHTFNVLPDDSEEFASARAFGDWSGFAWYNKYIRILYENTTTPIIGHSKEFDILDAPEDIRLKNDSYNLTQTISNLFLQPQTSQDANPVFHNDYLPSVLGTPADRYSTIGRQFYEKIANFVQNNKDIETCNIPQLYSVCKAIDVPIDDYNLEYPADLKRVMDIVSIHFDILRGVKDKYNIYLGPRTCNIDSKYTSINDQEFTLNRELSSLSIHHVVSAGEGLVIFDTLNNYYDIIYANETTALSALSGFGLREPIVINQDFNNYKIYEYKQNNQRNTFKNNLIDWENEYNTLSYETSTIEEWYGDYGLVEKWIDYELHKGLGFI